MAQLNITLDQADILRLLEDDTSEAFKVLLQETLNGVLRAESAEQLHAEPYERTSKRTGLRNGARERPLATRIGTITLTVPRHRDVPFKSLIFDNYKRSEAALLTTMAEMVVAGVSTAKVGRVMEEICGKSFSKQTVSEACKELDGAVRDFKSRPITSQYLFVMADATYLKVRENHRIASKALLIAIGLTTSGTKEIIGFELAPTETKESWTAFLSALRARGLSGMEMLTSDSHEGIIAALHEVYPGVAWQRCQAHFSRNITDAAPKKLRVGLRNELVEMFNCDTLEEARARRDEIVRDYAEEAPKAMERLDEGFDDAMVVMELPRNMRKCTRTSNYLERLNLEVKRRSKVIGVFPNEASVERLIGSVLMEIEVSWAASRKVYFANTVDELSERRSSLIKIAQLQRQMMAA